jgi:site-specific recombinase XerD
VPLDCLRKIDLWIIDTFVVFRQIQELLNHSDISQTVRYAKLQDESNKKALQNIF